MDSSVSSSPINQQTPQRAVQLRFALHPVDTLTDLAPPAWLIHGLMEVDTTAVLYGPSGCGKSFLAIDWAMCVASGKPWQGRQVRQGPVIYVIGEGARNVGKRIRAWKEENGISEIPEAFIVKEPVQLRDPEQVRDFLLRIQSANLRPRMIVFDTFARCSVGGEENSAKDMGEFIHTCRSLQGTMEANILIVHHTGKSQQELERGSSALRAGVDVMVLATGDSRILEVSNNKQIVLGEFEDLRLEMAERVVGVDPETGEAVTSLVLRGAGPGPGVFREQQLSDSERKALVVLAGLSREVKTGEWLTALNKTYSATVPRRTLDRWREGLLKSDMIEIAPGRKSHYQVTEKGQCAIGKPLAGNGENPNSASHCHTP